MERLGVCTGICLAIVRNALNCTWGMVDKSNAISFNEEKKADRFTVLSQQHIFQWVKKSYCHCLHSYLDETICNKVTLLHTL